MSPLVVAVLVLALLAWPGRHVPWRREGAGDGREAAPSTAGAGRTHEPRSPLRRLRSRAGDAPVDLEAAAALAELCAMALRSGGAPGRAVEVVLSESPSSLRPLLAELRDELARGGSGAAVWRRAAADHAVLAPMAAAWSLSEQVGVSLAPALEQAAASCRAQDSAHRRLEAASAGARATMWLLTLLPVVGLGAAAALGVSPVRMITSSAAAATSLGVGLVLTLLGWASGQAILRHAMRPGVS